MDLQKAKIFLEKINREFARMNKEPENIARIDVDIICAYTRELYDSFLSEKNTVAASPKPEPVRPLAPTVEFSPERPEPAVSPKARPPVFVPAPEPPEPVFVAPPPPPPPVFVPALSPEARPAPPKITIQPIVEKVPEPAPSPEARPVAVPAPVVSHSFLSPEEEALFEEKKARELSEKLAQTRIPDLSKHIALNDKLLFIKQLFGGNNAVFSDALMVLNHFPNFTEAKNYLLQNLVGRFDWTEKSRAELAKTFIQLVRRRYN